MDIAMASLFVGVIRLLHEVVGRVAPRLRKKKGL